MIEHPKSIVVISPHPDDETLGAGATIAKFVKNGTDVSVLVVSGHLPPLYHKQDFETTKSEAIRAFKELGVKEWEFLKIPATMVHNTPTAELNKKIGNFITNKNPQLVLIPFPDRHIDHRTIFDASVVCCRPNNLKAPPNSFNLPGNLSANAPATCAILPGPFFQRLPDLAAP